MWETIGSTDLHPKIAERYGVPYVWNIPLHESDHPLSWTDYFTQSYWVIHRVDFQRVLYEGAKSAGAMIRSSTPVELINQEIPAVTLAD
jgi:flavin-dependent dehydrogenase